VIEAAGLCVVLANRRRQAEAVARALQGPFDILSTPLVWRVTAVAARPGRSGAARYLALEALRQARDRIRRSQRHRSAARAGAAERQAEPDAPSTLLNAFTYGATHSAVQH